MGKPSLRLEVYACACGGRFLYRLRRGRRCVNPILAAPFGFRDRMALGHARGGTLRNESRKDGSTGSSLGWKWSLDVRRRSQEKERSKARANDVSAVIGGLQNGTKARKSKGKRYTREKIVRPNRTRPRQATPTSSSLNPTPIQPVARRILAWRRVCVDISLV
jgi:hypothetical protein